jgi:AcrR family transcriptional regulator
MGVKERKAREKETLRQDILDAARELFIREGYQAVSMRKIAEKIEYSAATIYLHFRDKDDIFDHLSEEAFGKLLAKLQSTACEAAQDPVEGLRLGLCAYVEFGLEHPDHYQITFMVSDARLYCQEPLRRDTVGCQAFECLRTGVGACIEAGLFRVDDLDLASQVLWAGVHGVTSLLIAKPAFPWVERQKLIAGMIDVLLKGLRA